MIRGTGQLCYEETLVARVRKLLGLLIPVAAGTCLTGIPAHSAQAQACAPIRTTAQFDAIRNNLSGHYCLFNDIDLGSIAKFAPIGSLSTPFTGLLDGMGHSIKNLKMSGGTSEYFVGLFGVVQNGTVRNLDVVGATISAAQQIGVVVSDLSIGGRVENVHVRQFKVYARDSGAGGGLVGANSGQILQSSAAGAVSGGEYLGGLVAWNAGLIRGSQASGTVGSGATVGGLVGRNAGRIENSRADTKVRNCAYYAGGLVGSNTGAIVDSNAAGAVYDGDISGEIGGLVGENRGLILRSSASGSVSGGDFAGGLAGRNWKPDPNISIGEIRLSYATGSVFGWRLVGGLVGYNNNGIVRLSQSTGSVTGGPEASAGGLVGIDEGGIEADSLALGPVAVSGVFEPGMIRGAGGLLSVSNGQVVRSYAAGPTMASAGLAVGGLTAYSYGAYSARSSFWDSETTGQANSAGGTKRTTSQFQSKLPNGFGGGAWAITPGVSYPYLTISGMDFQAPLATIALDSKLFTFVPIGQLRVLNYTLPPKHAARASLATVFAMLARAIGVTSHVASLKGVTIDNYFWDDASQTAHWSGPITQYATLSPPIESPVRPIAASTQISESNILGPIRSRKAVLIRGSYNADGPRPHWMLATSFVTNPSGNVTVLVANDPWTGRQVRIDLATKMVTSPANFPLAGFKVNGFRVVDLD